MPWALTTGSRVDDGSSDMPEKLDKRIAATYERDLKIAEWLEASADPKTGVTRNAVRFRIQTALDAFAALRFCVCAELAFGAAQAAVDDRLAICGRQRARAYAADPSTRQKTRIAGCGRAGRRE